MNSLCGPKILWESVSCYTYTNVVLSYKLMNNQDWSTEKDSMFYIWHFKNAEELTNQHIHYSPPWFETENLG